MRENKSWLLTALLGLSIVLTPVLVACGGQTTSSPTPTATPKPTPSPTPTATPKPTPSPTSVVITSPIVGTYTVTITQQDVASQPFLELVVGKWTMTLKSDGSDLLSNADNGVAIPGSYKVSASQVSFTDVLCAGDYGSDTATGTYNWTLQGKKLIMKAEVDGCIHRRLVVSTHPWVKQG